MTPVKHAPEPAGAAREAWRIVWLYLAFAGLWIWSSDALLHLVVEDLDALSRLSMLKGWAFVGLTALLLHLLLSRLLRRLHAGLDAAQAQAEQLRATQRQLEQAHEIAGLGQYELDCGSGRWWASPIAGRLLGLPRLTDLTLQDWQALVHPEDWPALQAYFQDVLARAERFDHLYRVRHGRDGTTRWIEARGEVLRDAQGQALRLIGTFQDRTEAKAAERQIADLLQRQQAMLDALPDLLFETDADGRVLDYHSHRSDLLAAPPERFLGRLMAEVLPPEAVAVCMDAIQEAARVGHSTGRRYALDLAQGRRWFELSVAPLRDGAAPKQRFVLIARDVSARQQAEQQLELAGRVFRHAREGIMVTDAQGDIVDVNEAFTLITGYPREEALGRNPRFLSSGQQSQAFYADLWRTLLQTGAWSGEVWNRRRSGEVYAQSLTISTVRGAQGQVLHHVALLSDITAAKRHQAELEHAAHFDALTGLPNRLLLSDRLHQAMTQATRRGTTLAVAYLDLDGFKQVNDRHGHATGDKLLVHVAQRLHEAMREGDTLARIGGDEFVVVLIDLAGPGSSQALVERLLRVAAEPVELGELTLSATASVGLTHFPQLEAVAPDQLIRQADQAMYKAKLAGKNRHAVFDAQLDSEARRHHASLAEIRQALAREEFVLHFQPQVNLRSGAVIGAEALIRWQHPQRGLLPPGEFLPQIEGEALAADLGDWVLRRALDQHAQWLDQGLRLPVGVNVSALHLLHPDFVAQLRAHLAARPRVEPSQLTLEILETSALNDLAQAADVVEACKRLGVGFELDDFGTGYSSLTYLRQLAVAGIKVDQSFVRNLLASHEDQTILRGILGLAQAFGMSVIAEGVETAEHGRLLLSLGCEAAQGYGIARPMPADRLLDWVRAWRTQPFGAPAAAG